MANVRKFLLLVTISTIHSAKGLEWDVVFWCDLMRDRRGPNAKVLIGRDGIALPDPNAEEQGPEWLRIQEEIGLEEEAELHSATEALSLSRCEMKDWFQSVIGLREPAMRRDTPDFGGAVARGQIVHDVLEQYRLDAELDGLIDDAVQKGDPDAPPPETDEGAGYRMQLRAEVELVAKHPAYREVADVPGARRELGFIHLTGPGNGWQGGFDLAAPGPEGWVLLEVKTGGDSDLDLKARQYGPQRDIYARAAEAIAGEPVKEFRFHFSRAGKQVRHAFDESERAALRSVNPSRNSGSRSRARRTRSTSSTCGSPRSGPRRADLVPALRDDPVGDH